MSLRRAARLVVCDPCLAAVGTHPWACAEALLSAARREGWQGDVVARTTFRAPAERPEGVGLHPILRHPGASKLTATAELDRLEGRSRGGWRPPWEPLLRGLRRRSRALAFAADLRPLMGELRAGDQFLVATATEIDALGLARAIAAARPAAGVGWHLWLHAPLLVDGGLPSADPRLGRVRKLLGAATRLASPHRLRFWATTPELAAEWTLAGGVPVDVLPMPLSAPEPRDGGAAGDLPLRVALLGDARPEKGFALVGPLLDRVAADPFLARSVRFAIQTNPGFDPRSRRADDRAVAEALGGVARHVGALVEVLDGPLTLERYGEELARADALLLPYDPIRYRHRCSGVLLEGMAAGKVAIVSAGGWMARQFHEGLRRHADRLAERHAALAEERMAGMELPARGELRRVVCPPAGADTLLIAAAWSRPAVRDGDDGRAFDAALRLRFWPGCVPESIVLAADGEGRQTPAVVRMAAIPAGATIAIDAPDIDDSPRLDSLSLRWLRCGDEAPLGASGIILAEPSVDGAVMAIGELIAHRGHYLDRAAEAAAAIARAHAPAVVFGRLVA